MLTHLLEEYPLEGCGLLAGKDDLVLRLYAIENRLESPTTYEMEPQQQLHAMLDMEDRGLDLLAIFHSHPSGPETPSAHDIATAYYPEAAHVIVSLVNLEQPKTRAFSIVGKRVSEIPFDLV
jgi:proteasome lid subunit RPN8/RPN11